MSEVARLRICEGIRLDYRHLDELGATLGLSEAERLVGVTFDELGEVLGDVGAAYRAGDVRAVVARVRGLAEQCERVGLAKVGAVSRAVVATGEAADAAAFAATVARLIRLVETSLTAACEAPDMVV